MLISVILQGENVFPDSHLTTTPQEFQRGITLREYLKNLKENLNLYPLLIDYFIQ